MGSRKRSPPSSTRSARKAKKAEPDEREVRWSLRLYVAGRSPKSEAARANLARLCEKYIPGQYRLEVVDLVAQPHLAQADQILAIPTLVRKLPIPMKRLIGDLSNVERAMVALDLEQIEEAGILNRG